MNNLPIVDVAEAINHLLDGEQQGHQFRLLAEVLSADAVSRARSLLLHVPLHFFLRRRHEAHLPPSLFNALAKSLHYEYIAAAFLTIPEYARYTFQSLQLAKDAELLQKAALASQLDLDRYGASMYERLDLLLHRVV